MALVLLFLGMLAIIVWAGVESFRNSRAQFPRAIYSCVIVVAGIAAYWTTFRFEYYSSENTQICGWPVPVVVFQRAPGEDHWDDFVGPTTALGYPMNVIIFAFLPSVVMLGFGYWQRWMTKNCHSEFS